jgi:mono/diheme cytochrome c family protein
MRTGVCIMLAGLYAMLVAARYEPGDFKARLVRAAVAWGFLGLAITVPSQAWYWRAIPAAITIKAAQVMPIPMQALRTSAWLAAAIGMLLILARMMARRLPVVLAGVLMLTGLAWFGSFEMFRESLRKPYVITGYIYGNGVEVALTDRYKKEGYASQIAYKTGDEGADLFLHSCRSCHTIDGYRALKPAFDGTDRAFIAAIVRNAQHLNGNMPPFLGTPAEADEIAGYVYDRMPHRTLTAICKETGEDLGARAYAVRCGNCHRPGTAGDKSKSFAGQGVDDLSTMLDNAAILGEGMPDYTGPPEERTALVAYLQSLGKKVTK